MRVAIDDFKIDDSIQSDRVGGDTARSDTVGYDIVIRDECACATTNRSQKEDRNPKS